MLTLDEFQTRIDKEGYIVFPAAVSAEMVERLNKDIASVYEVQRRIQIKNRVDNEGIAQHMIKSLWAGSSFRDFLENLPLKEYMDAYFGAPFILYGFSGIINLPNQSAIAQHKYHRDMRTYFPVRLSFSIIIMLDDFTENNGATMVLRGSHLQAAMPSSEEFSSKAVKIIGKRGDVLVYNSNVVHSAGHNTTDKARRALGYTLVRSFMKQQCQYHNLTVDSDSDWMKQILGYHSRTPSDLNEWYQPVESRMYRLGQG